MTTEITIQKRCICLRNKNEIWVSEETYQRIRIAREKSDGHFLIKIEDQDRELNTADIVEICTPSQMEDKKRIGMGDYKCAYGKWHKRRERCCCLRKKNEKINDEKKRQQEIIENRPMTNEERNKSKKIRNQISGDLRRKGIIK